MIKKFIAVVVLLAAANTANAGFIMGYVLGSSSCSESVPAQVIEFDYCGTPVAAAIFEGDKLEYIKLKDNATNLIRFDTLVNDIIRQHRTVQKVNYNDGGCK